MLNKIPGLQGNIFLGSQRCCCRPHLFKVPNIFCFAAPIKCVSSTHNLVLSDLESPPYSDTGLEHRFPNAVSIHPRPDPYELRYRKRSRTLSSVSSVDEDCEDDDRDSNGLYVHSPASFSSQGSNWQNEAESGRVLHPFTVNPRALNEVFISHGEKMMQNKVSA